MPNHNESSADTYDEIHKQMHRMSFGVDALDGLGLMVSHAIDEEIGVTGQQVSALIKCVEFSLLTSQRKMVAALNDKS